MDNWYDKLPKFELPLKDEELIKLWLESLKSGDYIQGKEYLYSINNKGQECYCCLGVASKVSGISECDLSQIGTIASLENDLDLILSDFNIPIALIEEDSYYSLVNILTNLNDSPAGWYIDKYNLEKRQYSFLEIAEYLENCITFKN